MSFGSDPGQDDNGLPPANTVIPDDARELDRDLLAYRREQRARRRRAWLAGLLRPLRWLGLDGHASILPAIATCAALFMLAGVALSVLTIGPASAPTVSPPASPPPSQGQYVPPDGTSTEAPLPAGLTELPPGTFTVTGTRVPVRTMRSAVLALVPPDCACDRELARLAGQANAAHVGLYFVGEGGTIPQIPAMTIRDGGGVAAAAADPGNVLDAAYNPEGLTLLLIYSDSTARVKRHLPAGFQLGPELGTLTKPGR